MNENDYILTLEEITELCRLYRACRLTPLEETELHYVLMNSRLDSPFIRETLDFMNVERMIGYQPEHPRSSRSSMRLYLSIAASVLVCLLASFIYFILTTRQETEAPILALQQSDSVGSIDPFENKTIAVFLDSEGEMAIEKYYRQIRTSDSTIMDFHRSSNAIYLNKLSKDYTEIDDDKDVIKVFEDIQVRLSKFVNMSIGIEENLTDLQNVKKKIIEKNVKL